MPLRNPLRILTAAWFAIIAVGWGAVAVPARALPSAPDLTGYREVDASAYTFSDHVGNQKVFFRTPDGLQCAIGVFAKMGSGAGCDGPMPTRSAEVNQIVLADHYSIAYGLWATADPMFVKTSGEAAPILHEGERVAFSDFVCGVGPDRATACTKGDPVTEWMRVSPSFSGVGPVTEGLPDGFPEPNDFIRDDDDYLVGSGPKNLFPTFAVGRGLTCTIRIFSGGEVGCDGPLPGLTHGENEVSYGLPSDASSAARHTETPRFDKHLPGVVRRLPVGHKISTARFGWCMALVDGVACYRKGPEASDPPRQPMPTPSPTGTDFSRDHFGGFVVTSTAVITY